MTGSESESDGHLELAKSKPGASKSAAQITDDLGVLGALRSGSSSSSGSSRVEVAKAKPGAAFDDWAFPALELVQRPTPH
ncbi:unnamed protein product [Symbiodinium necroappetens]|uniref:Uncharacterized protein n=1 Tax=Symbiodinium necroappetens TaxID=1628268 RepID=A0A813ACU4_9DINO|nr:unnamed protein product [Symbiodinium necroappetens]